ncbi:hypothetical protein LR013_00400 [candidate division NPL-UPA2 bacterium]|nr:hypothetical protein [candidate division NPL-UPA2 bacterium]
MKAELELRNIGGFKGTRRFEFQKGAINEVEASNAIGKTSLIRGLACALVYPLTHDEAIKEARNQGILRESLKNIYEKDAAVHLKHDDHTDEWEMRSDGTFGLLPKGDERFVWAGMLTQEARTIRQLVEGNSDFSWVPQWLSHAQRYAIAKSFIDSQITDARVKNNQLVKRREALLEEDSKLKQKKEERARLDADREQLAQQVDQREREHLERMKVLDMEIRRKGGSISEHEGRINRLQQEITRLEEELKGNAMDLQQLEGELQGIDIDGIRREVIQKVSEIDKEIGELRKGVAVLSGQKSAFTDAKSIFVQRGEREGLCPICKRSTIDLSFLEVEISKISNDILARERKIQALAAERTRWLQKEATERQRINKLNQEIKKLNDNKRRLNSNKSRAMTELENLRRELVKLRSEESILVEERAKLGKETEKWKAETLQVLKSIERGLQAVDREIADYTRKIQEDSFISLYGRERASFQQWQNRLRKLESKLSEVKEYYGQRQHQHEVQAIVDFNNNVKKVMTELGFTEFDQIAIDRDDMRLKVLRSGFIRQPVESLSTSEKYSIAIVLQIALRETYLPDIPFFIVDEVVVSYDEERKQRILDYLGEMAKEKGLYVIVTKLSEKAGEQILVKVR